MNLRNQFIAVILMALVTYIPRALPITFFRRKIRSNYIKSFLHYVPYAVLGALTFPDVFMATGDVLTATCGILVALILAWKEKNLVTVALGAVIMVYLVQFLK